MMETMPQATATALTTPPPPTTIDPPTSPEVLNKLRTNPLVRLIDPRRLEQLAAKCVLTRFRAGRKVVREGDAATDVHVLISGGVRVAHRAPGSEDGEAVVKLLGAPSIFGDSEALMGI